MLTPEHSQIWNSLNVVLIILQHHATRKATFQFANQLMLKSGFLHENHLAQK